MTEKEKMMRIFVRPFKMDKRLHKKKISDIGYDKCIGALWEPYVTKSDLREWALAVIKEQDRKIDFALKNKKNIELLLMVGSIG